ncbi:MAG: exodeoxyribonuclease V subunit beta [Balneolaceae bacterium]|nr:MAG: exodeoxyribonuclease V subunit beta [Balneolaceae bacterium]
MKQPLDSVFELKWAPRIVIEASAGTGKTYTIVGLVIRLLIEQKLGIDQILVMTFTKKATAELKERIFTRLKEAKEALEGKAVKDEFLKELTEKVEDKREAVSLVENAIHNFDDARVFTIHGFCQKVLTEHALLAGAPINMDVVQQDEPLAVAAEDFWRNFMDKYGNSLAGEYYISKMLEIAKTPEELVKRLKDLFSKPYAELEGEGMMDPLAYLQQVIETRKKLKSIWNEDEKEIRRILNACDVSRFQQHLQSRLNKLVPFIKEETFLTDTPGILNYFRADYLYNSDNLPKSRPTRATEKHTFFDVCSEYDELISDINKVKTTLIREAFTEISRLRSEASENSPSMTYDDLLVNLGASLQKPGIGEKLSASLRNKYPYALIDEFQDTDPIQFSIFEAIYPDEGEKNGLLLIGDPKQAIYGFRGADVYTYFQAKAGASKTVYTLQKNFRSSPELVGAVNTLFSGEHRPFLEREIEFTPSEWGKTEPETGLLIDGAAITPFEIIARGGVQSNKNASTNFALFQTVREITSLLAKAEDGNATINGNKMQAGDIAVLVSSHKDAAQLKNRLKAAGIGSVTYSNKPVFETYEATRLDLLMQAVLHPIQQKSINNGLLSGFFGVDLKEIHQLTEDDEKREKLTEELHELREVWAVGGFYVMFRKLLYQYERLPGLARLANADRVLTNLFQLAEICSHAEQKEGFDPAALSKWFRKKMGDPSIDEEYALLLESDQNLVKISTIHNSKGLEYPVVICLSLWEGREVKDSSVLQQYHPESSGSLTINFDQSESEQRRIALVKSLFEQKAEEVRKLYVAVTRAKYKCVVIWDTHSVSHLSGMGALLSGGEKIKEFIENYKKLGDKHELDENHYVDALKTKADSSGGTIRVRMIDEEDQFLSQVQLQSPGRNGYTPKPFLGRTELPVQNQLVSFSSLAHKTADATEPDYDQLIESYASLISAPVQETKERSIFSFPRGAIPGTAIHKLFELDRFDFDTVQQTDLKQEIEAVLEAHQIDKNWADVAAKMLVDVSCSKIPGLDLSSVSGMDQIREMEFHFRVKQPSADRLFEIIRSSKDLSANKSPVNNMLTGFIDLIVRQNGKYFILDYKSNHLGDSPEDYTAEKLRIEMQHAGYDLQYHLYTVALLKYLRTRIPDFSYESHIGGVAYLFVRGMTAGSSNGVWFHKPDVEVIKTLENELEAR